MIVGTNHLFMYVLRIIEYGTVYLSANTHEKQITVKTVKIKKVKINIIITCMYVY